MKPSPWETMQQYYAWHIENLKPAKPIWFLAGDNFSDESQIVTWFTSKSKAKTEARKLHLRLLKDLGYLDVKDAIAAHKEATLALQDVLCKQDT